MGRRAEPTQEARAVADYFLKAQDSSRAYRLTYHVVDQTGAIVIDHAKAVGVSGARLPDGTDLAGLDAPVDVGQVLVDQILGNLAACDLAGYKAVAKAAIDSRW
jgi:hypothetical protein